MTRIDRDLLASSDPEEATAAARAAVNEAPGDEIDCIEQQSSQSKLAELKALNHRLMVENLSLRSRLERIKSNRTLQRKFYIALGISLWLLFIFAAGIAVFISSNR